MLELHIVDSDKISKNRLDIIRDAMLSDETITMDNSILGIEPKGSTSKFWLGWKGVCDEVRIANGKKPLEIVTTENPRADIVIKLTNQINADGFSGWTTTIVDEVNNQILKSDITIYQTQDYTDNQFLGIMRHEIGHALDLAHSSAPEDLMAPRMITEFPYISPCDMSAMIGLYDTGGSSSVTCEI